MDYYDFIHPNHFDFFVQAAKEFKCHILVRNTGRATINWVGKRGYTGKRGDLKAKTANQNFGNHQVAGLVCSPILLPQVFSGDRLVYAKKKWFDSSHLITVNPGDTVGFDDKRQPRGCYTPYLVQTNPSHKHYGCVALVDMGLLIPRYVHGDYDLYAIIPAGQRFDPKAINVKQSTLGSTMAPAQLGLQGRLKLSVPNIEGQMSFKVANFINNLIDKSSIDFLGALMVNHGEHINIDQDDQPFKPILAVMPKQVNGEWATILTTKEDLELFYRNA